MEISSLIGHTSEILRISLKSHLPTDKIAREYLRSKKYLGSNDRRFISGLLYSFLRIKSIPDYVFDQIEKKSEFDTLLSDKKVKDVIYVLIGLLALVQLKIPLEFQMKVDSGNSSNLGRLIEELAEKTANKFQADAGILKNLLFKANKSFENLLIQTEESSELPLSNANLIPYAARYGVQPWIIESLISNKTYQKSELEDLLQSLFLPAPITLRINSGADKRQELIEKLRKYDPECNETEYSPWGINLSKRIDLNTVPEYKMGLFEVQDEGSQLISVALSPNQGDSILDACAGAGGKSLHLSSLMDNTGEISSTDVELKKLKELNNRAKKAGFDNITTYLVKNHKKRFHDKVLVDSPCSGMGTVRRNPMLKWTLSPKKLKQYNNKQYSILEHNSAFVKNGGVLVYATCSILPQENEMIIEKFLENHDDFRAESLRPAFEKFDITLPNLSSSDFQYQLLPSVHGCDGFYMAKMIRKQ